MLQYILHYANHFIFLFLSLIISAINIMFYQSQTQLVTLATSDAFLVTLPHLVMREVID
jgi:hypothetical protein